MAYYLYNLLCNTLSIFKLRRTHRVRERKTDIQKRTEDKRETEEVRHRERERIRKDNRIDRDTSRQTRKSRPWNHYLNEKNLCTWSYIPFRFSIKVGRPSFDGVWILVFIRNLTSGISLLNGELFPPQLWKLHIDVITTNFRFRFFFCVVCFWIPPGIGLGCICTMIYSYHHGKKRLKTCPSDLVHHFNTNVMYDIYFQQ